MICRGIDVSSQVTSIWIIPPSNSPLRINGRVWKPTPSLMSSGTAIILLPWLPSLCRLLSRTCDRLPPQRDLIDFRYAGTLFCFLKRFSSPFAVRIATTWRSVFIKVHCCPLLNSENRKIHVHASEFPALTPLIHLYLFQPVFPENLRERGDPTGPT